MKIKVGDLQRIIREELSASTGNVIKEAGDVEGYYAKLNRVPPAQQKAALRAAGSFLFGMERQVRAMYERAKATNSVMPPQMDELIAKLDDLLEIFSATATAVEAQVKRVERKAAVVPREETEEELEARLAAMKAKKSAGGAVGGTARLAAPKIGDLGDM